MIETVMIFALGFLAATLLALIALPAVSARSARLTKRRIDATAPLSAREIAAEKDHLRAQAAVAQRRLERKVEAARASRHADMAAIGARTLEAASLSRAVEARDADLAAAADRLGGLEADLGAARSEGSIGLATLAALEGAHRALLDDFLEARRETARAKAAAEAAISGEGAEPSAAADPGEVDLRASHAALAAERETLRASLAAAETALARGLAGRDPALGDADSELRARIMDVAEALTRRDRLPSVAAFPIPGSGAP